MTLLSDFKNIIGITGTSQDQFLIDYYLSPTIELVSKYSTNYKIITVKQQSGVQEYDLTDSAICTPVVSSGGVESVVHDGSIFYNLQYNKDYVIENNVLKIVDPLNTYNIDTRYKINEAYTDPSIDIGPPVVYTETNMPTKFFNAVVRYAKGIYNLSEIENGNSIDRKREDNLDVSYSGASNRITAIEKSMKEARQEIIRLTGKNLFDSIQVI
jgi:hypothetical protein